MSAVFSTSLLFSVLKLAPANVQKMLSNIHSAPVAMKPSNEEYATIPATKRQENKVFCSSAEKAAKTMEGDQMLRGATTKIRPFAVGQDRRTSNCSASPDKFYLLNSQHQFRFERFLISAESDTRALIKTIRPLQIFCEVLQLLRGDVLHDVAGIKETKALPHLFYDCAFCGFLCFYASSFVSYKNAYLNRFVSASTFSSCVFPLHVSGFFFIFLLNLTSLLIKKAILF